MPTSSSPDRRDAAARRSDRRRRTHHRTDSNGELLGDGEILPSSPSKNRPKQSRTHSERRHRVPESEKSRSTSSALTSGQLAALDQLNHKLGWNEYDGVQRPREREQERVRDRDRERNQDRDRDRDGKHKQERRRERTRERERERDRLQNEDSAREEHNERERQREEREREREREREMERRKRREEHRERKRRRMEEEQAAEAEAEAEEGEQFIHDRPKPQRYRSTRDSRRVVSGQAIERGTQAYYSDKEEFRDNVRRMDGSSGDGSYILDGEEELRRKKLRRNIFIGVGVLILLLVIIIPVAVVVSKKKGGSKTDGNNSSGGSSSKPSNGNLNGIDPSSVPAWAHGTYLDPFSWYDTLDFNLTFTNDTVGGLYVMGLNSTWDDSARANANVPPLNETWKYGSMPVRGINLGGWLSIEPFITPSLFSSYSTHDNVVDEWTLCQTLGGNAKSTIEKHYSQFVQESTFVDIQAAGFDHIRIPFSYWAVTTYDGDPYIPLVSWRYLLRAIEWARKYGLRINLDLHGAPGSQNGWNHSGRQGTIGWLNGTNGALNGDRTIAIHKQLSAFFTQPRYKNIIAMYGLVNEPRMVSLDTDTVLQWSQKAIEAIQANNYTGIIVFGDGFMGLNNWQGKLQGYKNLLLDAHQYVIFNVAQIVLDHTDKINFACSGWTGQTQQSQNTATGFGPTLTGEWSQADTDCAQYLNNVGIGSRWEGTLNMASTPGGGNENSVLSPTCPTHNNPTCSCTNANADPGSYSTQYKQWLLMFAEAQMYSFEQGWGWFYWTWKTEKATQWSYQAGLAAGIMPKLAYQRSFDCSNGSIPDYASSGLPEFY